MIKRRNTPLNAMLADWDEKKTPDNKVKYFKVAFITQSGEFRYIKKGVKSGLKFNMKKTDFKAVQPVDDKGFEIGHVYPVWIHAIISYSGNLEFSIL